MRDLESHLRPVDAVAKHNMVERDVAANGRQRGAGRIEFGFRRGVENIAEPLHRIYPVKILPELSPNEGFKVVTIGQQFSATFSYFYVAPLLGAAKPC